MKLKNNILKKYAELAIKMGVNVQKDQVLVLNAPINTSDFVEYVVEEAYQAGAKQVIVQFYDDKISRLHYKYQSTETLCDIPSYAIDQKTVPVRDGACVLHIISEIPEVMKGIDPEKMSAVAIARQKSFKELNEITMANRRQWSIVGYPNIEWARKVFPNLNDEEAFAKLSDAILDSVQVLEDNDAVDFWKTHDANLGKHVDILNKFNFKHLHFKNSLGTDLVVELVKDHLWAGGNEETPEGIMFNANMPTEEVFSMPYKYGVNGKVVSTKPLSYNGNLIDDFSLVFKDGKVVEYDAKENLETLKTLIDFDGGSRYLGEVALVPYHSPISMSNILFYNTLYDENASCHLALGRAYPMNIKNGSSMSQEELNEAGSNDSMTHVDFMFGSEDMEIIGTTFDNQEIKVFENGDFVI